MFFFDIVSSINLFNTTIESDGVTTSVEGTLGGDAVLVVTPVSNSRYVTGEDYLRIPYKRLPIDKYVNNTVSIIDDPLYTDVHSLLPAINKAYSVSLTPEDVLNLDIEASNRSSGYYTVPLICNQNAKLFYGSVPLIIGDLGSKINPTKDDGVYYAYILNDAAVNTLENTIIRVDTSTGTVDTGWVVGANINSVVSWVVDQIAITKEHIILTGDFSVNYTNVRTGVITDTGPINQITLTRTGLLDYHANITNAGFIYSSTDLDYYFNVYNDSTGTTITRYSVSHDVEHIVVKSYTITASAVTPDGGLVYVSKPALYNGHSMVSCNKVTSTLGLDVSFNTIRIELYDVTAGDYTTMPSIYNISATNNYVDFYIDTGMSPSTSTVVPYVNESPYLPPDLPDVSAEAVGWLPVVRSTYEGATSLEATGYSPVFYYFDADFYWNDDTGMLPDIHMSSNDEYIALQVVRANNINYSKSLSVLTFKSTGEPVLSMPGQDIRNICSLVAEDGSNIRVLPNSKIVIAGKMSPTLRITENTPFTGIKIIDMTTPEIKLIRRPDGERYPDIELSNV